MTREEEIDEKSSNELGSIDYQFGFSCGAKWADETMIDKACEWLMEIENGTTITNIDDFVEGFRKAMEGGAQ